MPYQMSLYELHAEAFAEEMRKQPEVVFERTKYLLTREQLPDLKLDLVQLLKSIIDGQMPQQCSGDWFVAFALIADANLKSVPFPILDRVQEYQFLQELGLLASLSSVTPPFPTPIASTSNHLHIGFLPYTSMSTFRFQSSATEMPPGSKMELESELEELLIDFGVSSDIAKEQAKLDPHFSDNQISEARDEFSFVLQTLERDRLDLLTILT